MISYQFEINEAPNYEEALFYDCEFTQSPKLYYPHRLEWIQLYQSSWDKVSILEERQINWAEINNFKKVVFHAPFIDLRLWQLKSGQLPNQILDTQLAYAFCSPKHLISYGELVQIYLKKAIDKTEKTSDWGIRPMSSSQAQYASWDVYGLAQIFPLIVADLKRLGRYEWWLEDCQYFLNKFKEPLFSWMNLSQINLLYRNPIQIHQAKILCQAREKVAKSFNINRQDILTDKQIIQLASAKKNSLDEWAEHLKPNHLIWHELEYLESAFYSEIIPEKIANALSIQQQNDLKALTEKVKKLAEDLNISSIVIANRDELRQFIRAPESSKLLKGWRSAFFQSF